jgi:streptogramin lyase
MRSGTPGSRRLLQTLVVVVALVAVGCDGDEPEGTTATTAAPSFDESPTLPVQVEGAVELPGANFIAEAGHAMWVSQTSEGKVSSIEPDSMEVKDSLDVGGSPDFLTTGFGDVWVLSSETGHVWRIDPVAGEVVGETKLPGGLRGLNPGFGAMWIADHDQNKVLRLDPESLEVTGEAKVPEPADVVAYQDSLWVASESGAVIAIDPESLDEVERVEGRGAHAIAAAYGSIWVSSGSAGSTVTRIDPQRGLLDKEFAMQVGAFPDRMVAMRGLLWVGQYQVEEMQAINPGTNRLDVFLPTGAGAAVIAKGFGSLWAANGTDGTVWRITPLPLVVPESDGGG